MFDTSKKNTLLGFCLFGSFGLAVEIFFSAFKSNYDKYALGEALDFGLTGQSYVWMFPIYGSAFLLMDFFFPIVKQKVPQLFARIPLFILVIFFIEYLAGFVLQQLTGKCPWEYHSPYSVHGYINLAYTPFWVVFAIGLERVYEKTVVFIRR
ncbi:MAG: putative ABC transporter permease [Bacteroidia bacterium]